MKNVIDPYKQSLKMILKFLDKQTDNYEYIGLLNQNESINYINY
jgi:hypothetical protein